MADRSHLTPVPVADRLGRLTTVYRNLAARMTPAGSRSLRAIPAPPQAATESADSPLPAIRPRRRSELAAFARSAFPTLQQDVHAMLREPNGRLAGSLALNMIDDHVLPEDDVIAIVTHASSSGAEHVIDTLRIIAHHRRNYEGASTTGLRFAVNGLQLSRTGDRPSIRTVRDLESATAVVHFVATVGHRADTRTLVGRSTRSVPSVYLTDSRMGELIRRRPEDVDRIIDYVSERSTRTSHPHARDVEAWLDSDAAALSGGWL